MHKRLFVIVLIVLSIGFLGKLATIHKVRAWTGTIYIRSDGSVDPFDAPIQREGDYYRLLDNIDSNGDGIVVEKNDSVIDGSGYTLQGNGSGSGVVFYGIAKNVTIKNMNIKSFFRGIFIMASSHSNVIGNKLSNNHWSGIEVHECYEAFNHIEGNNVTDNNEYGILLIGSKNTFRDNHMIGNRYNFGIAGSLDNDVDTSNTVNGKPVYYWVDKRDMTVPSNAGLVVLVNCTQINVQNLNLAENSPGILLISTTNSTISRNHIVNNQVGVWLHSSSDNTISRNIIEHNDGGIFLDFSSNNNLMKANNVSSNLYSGIAIYSSENNKIVENDIMYNDDSGLSLSSSSNGEIYHNNFLNNMEHIDSYSSTNVWDDGYPSGGSYWDDYTGEDPDHDGIGNTEYTIDVDNVDHYPLMNPWIPSEYFPFFSQKNPLWSGDPMGLSGLTVGDFGCAMTSTAMVLMYYGVDTDPGVLNAWLSGHGGYTSGGALYWSKPAEYSEGMVQFIHSSEFWSFSSPSTKHWDKLNQELNQGRPVIVRVDSDPSPSYTEHWVLVTHRSGSDYYINDPLDLSQVSGKTLSAYDDSFFGMRFYHSIPSSGHTFTYDLEFESSTFPISFFSNSSISNLNISESLMQLSFSVSGLSGDHGFCNVSIPKSLLKGAPWTVWLENESSSFLESENASHSFIHTSYAYSSTIEVTIKGSWIIPEFPSFLMLPLFMIATLLTIIIHRRKHTVYT